MSCYNQLSKYHKHEENKTINKNLYSRWKLSWPFLIFESFRPQQWTKNLFIFSAIVFSRNLFNEILLYKALLAFVIFCLLSGSIYIINDLFDIREDQSHPVNSRRPLASSRLSAKHAIVVIASLIPSLLILSYIVDHSFFIAVLCYVLLQALYTIFLKHIVILDVFATASGFLLRVVAGALVIQVEISSWLLICTISLSLFLALCKRRFEIVVLSQLKGKFRRVLEKYTPYMLDQMISVASSATVISYILYTLSDETIRRFGTRRLVYTVPLVIFGIFRYLYLVHHKNAGGNPETTMFADPSLLTGILVWALLVVLIVYG